MAGGWRRVLVVEDDEIIRSFLVEALADEGYEVDAAANGSEALELVRQRRPDVILLDLMMPEMDGWVFREEQRRLTAPDDIPLIILSAGRDLEERARTLGPLAIFPKPFDLDELLATLRRLGQGGAERE